MRWKPGPFACRYSIRCCYRRLETSIPSPPKSFLLLCEYQHDLGFFSVLSSSFWLVLFCPLSYCGESPFQPSNSFILKIVISVIWKPLQIQSIPLPATPFHHCLKTSTVGVDHHTWRLKKPKNLYMHIFPWSHFLFYSSLGGGSRVAFMIDSQTWLRAFWCSLSPDS